MATTPAHGLAELYAAATFRFPFRRYQGLALAACERGLAAGQQRSYLVLPPGAGKTALGLEVARRLGRRALVLCPNTAVQAQWLRQWEDFQPATLAAESRFVAAQHERFRDLTGKLLVGELGSTPFLDWVWRRAGERAAVQGACLSWSEFEREHPSLALAALRLYSSLEHRLPEGARLAERHRLAPTADDWVALIDDYCRHCLLPSADQADHAAWQQLRRALLSLGYVLTARGARAYVSPVDRVLALSASKGLVAVEILAAERDALGDHPRALVLCDYEKAGSDVLAKLRGPAIAHAANGASRGRAGADPGHGAHRGLLPRHCHRPHRLAGRTGAGTAGTRSPRPPIAIGAGTQSPRPPIAIGAGTRCASARSSRRDRMAGRPAGRTWSSCVPPTPPGNRAATCPRSLVISKRATAAVW